MRCMPGPSGLSGPPRHGCNRRAASSRIVRALAQPLKTRPASSTHRVDIGSDHSLPADVSPLVHSILSSPALEGSNMLQLLKVTEAYWKALRNSKHEPNKPGPKVVKRVAGKLHQGAAEYDICICGGTLGVILGLALQVRGHRVCIIEKRKLEGRNQEWNISREELNRLVAQGLLTASELEPCIVSEFNPVRVSFRGSEEIYVRDVLNVGVQPRLLLDTLKHKFLAAGGALFEHTAFKSAEVFDDGVVIRTLSARHAELPLTPGDANRPLACSPSPAAGPAGAGHTVAGAATAGTGAESGPPSISCRLVLDCMGHWGPIVKQIRGGAKPSAMVVVVGGCCEGIPEEKNTAADLLHSFRDSEDDMQLFWEAFPAAGGLRTSYMFTYLDAEPQRPTFAALLHKYFTQLPEYQAVPLRQLQFKRVLFGAFPCWPGSSPLPPAFDRVLQVGDAAAGQSPLSFGGFGSMIRQLPRLAEGIDEALQGDFLSKGDLAWLNPYQPSLSVAWLFQRAMSVGVGQLKQGGAAGAARSVEQQQQQQQQVAEANSPLWKLAAGAVRNAIVPAPGLVHDGQGQEPSQAVQHVAAQHASAQHVVQEQLAAERAEQQAAQQQQQQQQQHDSGCPAGGRSTDGTAAATAAAAAAYPATAVPPAAAGPAATADGSGWLDPGHINRLLRCNFDVMRWFGEGVMRPFLQDTLRFVPLAATMVGMSFRDPMAVVTVVRQLGAGVLLDWTRHYLLLGLYTLLHTLLSPLRRLLAPRGAKAGQRQGEAAATATGTVATPAAPAPAGGSATEDAAEGGSPRVAEGDGAWQQPRAGKGPAVHPLSGAALKARYVALRALDALAAGAGME